MCCRPPIQKDLVAQVDPDLPGAMETYQWMKWEELERELRGKNADLERRLRELEAETNRRIREKDAEKERRVQEARGLAGLPAAVLLMLAPDQAREAVLEAHKWAEARGLGLGHLALLQTQGGQAQEVLQSYLDALLKGLGEVVRSMPMGPTRDALRGLLEALLREAP